MADRTVLFEAGQAGPPFLEKIGVSCEFKVIHCSFKVVLNLHKVFYVLVIRFTSIIKTSDIYFCMANHSIERVEEIFLHGQS